MEEKKSKNEHHAKTAMVLRDNTISISLTHLIFKIHSLLSKLVTMCFRLLVHIQLLN